MRPAILGILCLIFGSCREILPVQVTASINGYELDGILTSASGLPVQGAEVRLFYDYNLVSQTPTDTIPVIVRDSTRIVDIAVYTPAYTFVRELFLGYLPIGPVRRAVWDGLDEAQKPVPSGKYLIRYVVDTAIVKYSTVIVDGHATTTTDVNGKFVIPNNRLPVGAIADFYYPGGSFAGAFEVIPAVDLEFAKGPLLADYTNIALNTNQTTTGAFTLQ